MNIIVYHHCVLNQFCIEIPKKTCGQFSYFNPKTKEINDSAGDCWMENIIALIKSYAVHVQKEPRELNITLKLV